MLAFLGCLLALFAMLSLALAASHGALHAAGANFDHDDHDEEGTAFTGEVALARAAAGSCLITASGTDGVGHRMEAAITCIAVAAEQNMTYVHTPLVAIEHGEHAAVMERFFGFSKHYPTVGELGLTINTIIGATSSTIISPNTTGTDTAARARAALVVARKPLPRIGSCRESRWYGTGAKACRRDRSSTVHTADNCFDQFWCETRKSAELWETVRKDIRAAYDAGTDHPSTGFSLNEINIVVHIR